MSSIKAIFKDNDMVLEVSDITNDTTGVHINDATVTATIKDSTGADVSGIAFPITLSYVANSDGVYRGLLPAELVLTSNARYKAIIDAVSGSGSKAHWEVDLVCKIRK